MDHNALLAWDHMIGRFAKGWVVGSEDENGKHLGDISGWPYSVYRKANEIGVTDIVLCHGIQSLDDATELAMRLNMQSAGIR